MDHRERISRWMLAIGLWGCALWLARYGFNQLELGWFFPAMILGLIGLSRVFRDLIELAAKPFTMMIDAIVFPKIHGGKPPPNYKLAEYYLKEGRWEEAEEEYRIIIKNHRKETQAYIALMRLLFEMRESDEAKKVFQKATKYLRNHPECLSDVEMEWHRLKAKSFPI